MKKLILLALAVPAFLAAHAQGDWGKLDYAVPESPAFKLINKDPSSILRPTSAKKLGVNVGNYFANNGLSIPSNLGVEVSPALLINPNVNLTAYNKMPALYRTRVSLATNYSLGTGYNIAWGLRVTLIDKTDLRTNSAFLNALSEYLLRKSDSTFLETTRATLGFPSQGLVLIALNDQTDPRHAQVTQMIDSLRSTRKHRDSLDIESLRQAYKQRSWNALIWEVGVAGTAHSPDSLIENLGYPQRFALWTTCGLPVGNKIQLLLGLNMQRTNDTLNYAVASRFYNSFAVASRMYYGTNDAKWYGEAEYRYVERNIVRGAFGYEMNLTDGAWVHLVLNADYDLDRSKLVVMPGVTFGLGTRQQKK